MKKVIYLLSFNLLIGVMTKSQTVLPPDKLYGELFREVQLKRIFSDSKTFVDALPRKPPAAIMTAYLSANDPAFDLKKFVEANFQLPDTPVSQSIKQEDDVRIHIKNLWEHLARNRDENTIPGGSMLPLPYPYIVPGGRFREIYYWDSYFTMLGLQESGEQALIENMVNNFAYLINEYGHIPNGNRTYYLSRSQPPFFAMMVELLAEMSGKAAYAIYLSALEKEYDYWMDKSAPTRHVVKMPDGSTLNRYYDQLDMPRQESYVEDYMLGKDLPEARKSGLYRDLRSAAESGWDFSSRWLEDGKNLSSIQTTDIIPVDLNSFLYNLEKVLARAYKMRGDLLKERYFTQIAERRKNAINKYCWSSVHGWYVDYNIATKRISTSLSLAGVAPLYCQVAPASRLKNIAYILKRRFLREGGLVATLKTTGHQWDEPNGWAPLQWMAIKGLINYKETELAELIAKRWIALNTRVYRSTGRLMEKYDVTDLDKPAGGGEYPSQDGFGWTNGVLLKLITMYGLAQERAD
ncbi:MAG: alpha,alpha-trehalase TreA [Chitinophagaceae bacterium]|nr:MAG: alpha,alpha-trehalase TreA [Chitinophagaceae bacterium]